MASDDCILCDPARAEAELDRVTVWEDRLWRLSMSTSGYTLGFGYLEPIRHVPHLEDLDGDEAASLGATLARVTRALKDAADAQRVYVYVFGGGVPHLHIHLAPHVPGDALNTQLVRGEVAEERLPSGATRITSREFSELSSAAVRAVIDRARSLL